MINENSIIEINDISVTDIDGEKVMMDLNKGQYYVLNESGAVIWDACKNKITYNELLKIILSKFDVDEENLRKSLEKYLIELKRKELITIQ